jgi:hypothetical protein
MMGLLPPSPLLDVSSGRDMGACLARLHPEKEISAQAIANPRLTI